MEYDPVKDEIGAWVQDWPLARRLFYAALDWLFLRTWYVHDALERYLAERIEGRAETASSSETADAAPSGENAAVSRSDAVEVLDAGSGFGQYTYHIVRTYPQTRVTAVDVKTDYLEDCRRFFRAMELDERARWLEGDLTSAEEQPFDREEGYDFILSVDVMEHIEDDQFVLDRFADLLAPGGYLLINTPSTEGGSDVEHSGEEGFIDEHARPGYDPADLEGKLERAGLEPVETRYGYGPPGSAAWRMLIRTPMQLLGRSRWWALALPLYYLPVLPVGMMLNALDLRRANETGTGLTVVARRPVDG